MTATAIDIGTDEHEWAALEAAQPTLTAAGEWTEPQDVASGWPVRPHTDGYRPDLPLLYRGSAIPWSTSTVRTKKTPKPKTLISETKAHPLGYRPDLPTFGYSNAALMRATTEDRAAWKSRPLTYAPIERPWCDNSRTREIPRRAGGHADWMR